MECKTCNKCGKELPATTEYFYKEKSGKYGLNGRCKECKNNKDKINEYLENNKEKIAKYKKDYSIKNKEHFIPISKGGKSDVTNILPSCKSCNSSKCDEDFGDWYPKQKYYSRYREKNIYNYLKTR